MCTWAGAGGSALESLPPSPGGKGKIYIKVFYVFLDWIKIDD